MLRFPRSRDLFLLQSPQRAPGTRSLRTRRSLREDVAFVIAFNLIKGAKWFNVRVIVALLFRSLLTNF